MCREEEDRAEAARKEGEKEAAERAATQGAAERLRGSALRRAPSTPGDSGSDAAPLYASSRARSRRAWCSPCGKHTPHMQCTASNHVHHGTCPCGWLQMARRNSCIQPAQHIIHKSELFKPIIPFMCPSIAVLMHK